GPSLYFEQWRFRGAVEGEPGRPPASLHNSLRNSLPAQPAIQVPPALPVVGVREAYPVPPPAPLPSTSAAPSSSVAASSARPAPSGAPPFPFPASSDSPTNPPALPRSASLMFIPLTP